MHFLQKLTEHLDLIEGVVVDLLQTKWKSFIKRRFASVTDIKGPFKKGHLAIPNGSPRTPPPLPWPPEFFVTNFLPFHFNTTILLKITNNVHYILMQVLCCSIHSPKFSTKILKQTFCPKDFAVKILLIRHLFRPGLGLLPEFFISICLIICSCVPQFGWQSLSVFVFCFLGAK